MKQTERRYTDTIVIECEMSLREKLRVLFSKKFVVKVDLDVGASTGILDSEYEVLTL